MSKAQVIGSFLSKPKQESFIEIGSGERIVISFVPDWREPKEFMELAQETEFVNI